MTPTDSTSSQKPTPNELKHFSRTIGIAIMVLFGLFIPLVVSQPFKTWPFVGGLLLVIWGEVLPASLTVPYRLWFRFGMILSAIFQPIVLATVFFGLVTPIGWLRRSLGASRIKRKQEERSESYRQSPEPATHLEDPF